MQSGPVQLPPSDAPEDEAFKRGLLSGYRFSLCSTPEAISRAIDVRRRVYVHGNGYDVPVPDAYDPRSWFLLAEDVETGTACGTVRLTPRRAGPLECEEYFRLPLPLRNAGAVEITRFAILPEYRKGKTFLPVVSLGLFNLVKQVIDRIDARNLVICAKPERVWTYEWMRFQRTGLSARYEKLAGGEHELLYFDLRRVAADLADHPFRPFLVGEAFPESQLAEILPELGFPAPERLCVGA
ncbi:MAG: GNAT family N-acetyltransferase [bacterium]|nr:GNAT family N-acetyltransferase [bacterium]